MSGRHQAKPVTYMPFRLKAHSTHVICSDREWMARLLIGKSAKLRELDMKTLLIVEVLLICAAPLCAHAQQSDPAKLKANAQRVVSIIQGDKAKSQVYCQINSLGGEIDLAAGARDEQKADALTKKINDLEKQLGSEYVALFDALNNADPNSNDFQDIMSLFDTLDKSCPH
jgi:hypothetical protein